MKSLSLITIMAVFLLACESNSDANSQTTHRHHYDIVGGGNEPGWDIEINHQKRGYTFVMHTDYGETRYRGVLELLNETHDGQQFKGQISEKQPIHITTLSQICHDDADKAFNSRIIVQLGDTRLTGCANTHATHR